MSRDEIGEEILKQYGTYTNFARALGISKEYVMKICKGENIPSIQLLQKMKKVGVSERILEYFVLRRIEKLEREISMLKELLI